MQVNGKFENLLIASAHMEIRTETLPESEFSPQFIQGMIDRMAMSYPKYGSIKAYPLKADALQNLQGRLDKYRETGNTEWLIDAANYCMIEFMRPSHPDAHFRSTSSDESPGLVRRDGTVTHEPLERKTREGD